MAEVMPSDILLRIGGGTLARHEVLAVAGARRVHSPNYRLIETFTRATVKRAYRDRDGTGRKAAAGNMALDWPTGLLDAAGIPIGGPLSEGARTQLVPDPENFGAWAANVGTPVKTAGQADPFGGTGAYLINDDDGAAIEGISETVSFTGDGTKALALFVRQGSVAINHFGLHDLTAGVWRHQVRLTWAAGVPTPTTIAGSGTFFTVENWGGGWYRILFNAASVVAANTNNLIFRPTDTTGALTGTAVFFGANAWNSPFPSSYQAPGEAAGVADALTGLFNWGPSTDITALVRLARAYHMDTTGALGVSPGIFSFGAGAAARIGAYFDPAARNIISVIDTATTDATQTIAIPAGNPVICIQYKNLTTGGQTALDVGSGMTAFSSAATGFSAFSTQTMRAARYDDELFGVFGDAIVARGLRTRAEMMALP